MIYIIPSITDDTPWIDDEKDDFKDDNEDDDGEDTKKGEDDIDNHMWEKKEEEKQFG